MQIRLSFSNLKYFVAFHYVTPASTWNRHELFGNTRVTKIFVILLDLHFNTPTFGTDAMFTVVFEDVGKRLFFITNHIFDTCSRVLKFIWNLILAKFACNFIQYFLVYGGRVSLDNGHIQGVLRSLSSTRVGYYPY